MTLVVSGIGQLDSIPVAAARLVAGEARSPGLIQATLCMMAQCGGGQERAYAIQREISLLSATKVARGNPASLSREERAETASHTLNSATKATS